MSFSGVLSVALGAWPNIKTGVVFSRLDYPMSMVNYAQYSGDWDFRFYEELNEERVSEPRPIDIMEIELKKFTDGVTTLCIGYAKEINTLFFWSGQL